MVEKKIGKKKLRLVVDDITDIDVEAFVYDITEDAKLSSGYGGAIATRGGKKVQEELDEIGSCPKAKAIITSAGKMKAKHIIHVNGPKFFEPDEEKKLRKATRAALALANENQIKRLAFPPIGTGLYQVDQNLCAKVLVEETTKHLKKETTLEEVLLVALDTREQKPFEKALAGGK
ncbi:MAG: macro domain-containing protein [Deltaproteobacteria bacterium]|jgi:O-acetyl-ADP-ribose deacetylase (regulator of RNase III)|nr:macro domain-containing protein [Deltaproteobacteria bacterium]MBW2537867.1 macro domain-containing protein [Deltaproteobacteria bacterium]